MKLRTIINSVDALNVLSSKEPDAVTAYRIGQAVNKLNPMIEGYNKQRNKLLEKYGTKIIEEDGQTGIQFTFEEGQKEKFDIEVEKLLDTTESVHITRIKLSTLKSLNIKPIVMAAIEWLIEDDLSDDSKPASNKKTRTKR